MGGSRDLHDLPDAACRQLVRVEAVAPVAPIAEARDALLRVWQQTVAEGAVIEIINNRPWLFYDDPEIGLTVLQELSWLGRIWYWRQVRRARRAVNGRA